MIMSDMGRIESKIFIRGQVKTLTGLHIGGNSVGMSIGGADNVVVRNPLSNVPYIPGSSLRGKMRALLERVRGLEDHNPEGGYSYSKKGEALAGKKPDTLLGKLFGIAAEGESRGPTRLIVRDAPMTKKSEQALKDAPNTDMPMTEVKTEVWIDRITSAANPRQTERVPAGVVFDFELVLTVLAGDDENQFLGLVFEGLHLVEADTLGGNGSRGYGQVRFNIAELKRRTVDDFKQGAGGTAIPTDGFSLPEGFEIEPEDVAA